MNFKRIVPMAHDLLAARVQVGDAVVDATAGNGHDTVFLAQRVGETGQVYTFDIQHKAIENTRNKLEAAGLSARAKLCLRCHSEIAHTVAEPIQAAVFNLGYLPGSDQRVATKPDTTVEAISAALSILNVGGIVVIVLYRGHRGGREEAAAVEQYVRTLSPARYTVLKYEYINLLNDPPYILAVESH